MTSPQKLYNKLAHAKRESQALKAQLEANKLAAEEMLASFERSVYMPEATGRRSIFKRARDKYKGQ